MHPTLPATLLALHLLAPAAAPEPAACPGGPSAEVAARRAVALGLVASRVWLEIKLQRVRTHAQVQQLRARAQEVERRASAWGAAAAYEPGERALMQRPLGTWTHAEVADHSWAMEQAGSLLWAVGVVRAIPDFDRPFTQAEAMKPIMQDNGGEQVLRRARLRPAAELARGRDEAALFAWRARAERSRRTPPAGQPPAQPPPDVRDTVRRAVDTGATTRSNGADLLAGPTPVAALGLHKLGLVGSVARSRQQALAFACPAAR